MLVTSLIRIVEMERRIALSLFYMSVITAVIGIFITTFVYYGVFREEMEDNLAHECKIVAQCYDKISSPDELSRFSGGDFRITLINKSGIVLFESDADAKNMQNHLDRPEIKSAIKTGTGRDTRYSDTIGVDDYYYAISLEDGNILRVSMQADSIFSLFKRSFIVIIGIIIGIVIILMFVSVKITDMLIAPIKRIPEMIEKHRSAKDIGMYPEIVPLVDRLVNMRNEHERMRQEFTANVSHELKTPLTSISGYAEIIKTGMAQGEKIFEFAGKIYKESERLQTLIGDIIRLSELDTTNTQLFDSVDLKEIAEECKEQLSSAAEKRGIYISIVGDSEQIKGNEKEIHDLVYNLIDNAIKYNRENGNIDIKIENKGICVSDTGIGIARESIPRIFERFYRTDKGRSRSRGGTGLGLSIVHHVAERHGAKIDVESTVNVGTTIKVKFKD